MWLFIPSAFCPSLPAEEGSISDCTSPSPEAGLFVTSSGKPTLRQLSWPGWKRRPWHKLLSGTTCAPSMASRGAASWIASLAGSPARTSATPDCARGSAERAADSGLTTLASLARFDPASHSLKTSQRSLFGDSMSSSPILPRWGSMRSGVLWERTMPELPTAGIVSSSWPTPDVPNGGRHLSPEDVAAKGATAKGKRQVGLENAAKLWPTPDASVSTGYNQTGSAGAVVRPCLAALVRTWSTPRSSDGAKGGPNMSFGAGGEPLPTQAAKWPTPTVADADKVSNRANFGQVSLANHPAIHGTPDRPALNKSRHGLQDLGRTASGARTSGAGRVLNPRFVEALMGWPSGWSACGSSGMASFPHRPLSPSASSLNDLPEAA